MVCYLIISYCFNCITMNETYSSDSGSDCNFCLAWGDWIKPRNRIVSDLGGAGQGTSINLECYCYIILFRICVSHTGANWICNLELVIGKIAFQSKWLTVHTKVSWVVESGYWTCKEVHTHAPDIDYTNSCHPCNEKLR